MMDSAMEAAKVALQNAYYGDDEAVIFGAEDLAQAAIAAYLAAKEAEGFVMVPVEPTEAMVRPFPMLKDKTFASSIYPGDMRAIWGGMLAARPREEDR